MTEKTKMSLESMDIAEQKTDQLRELLQADFPEIFSEDELDFRRLQEIFGQRVEAAKERFGLGWPGKAECMKVLQQPSIATLRPVRSDSENFDETNNVFIEGDNLEVIKLLQKAYFNRIKLIYIDPPYNTGSDFIYPDKYAESLETYLAYTGQIDAAGKKFSTNTDTAGRYHSRWLNMMYPRLYLAKNLLRKDGVIFVSVDDTESANLKKLCDEIYGEENFIAQMVWEGAFKNDARQIGTNHEYVMVYAKNRSEVERSWSLRKEAAEPVLAEVNRLMELHGEDYEAASEELAGWFRANKAKPCFAHRRFHFIDKYGAYKEDDPTAPGGRKFELINPNTGGVIPLRENRGWSFDQSTFEDLVSAGKISFKSPTSIMVRRYFHETDTMTPQSVFYQPARSASERLTKLLGANVFDFPKDETVIQQFVEMATGDGEDIVLDFFAGSGPTAHAVMKHNFERDKDTRFILVQLPERCSEDSVAAKAGYATIAEICRDRIRKAAAELHAEIEESGQTKLEEDAPIDIGFRAFSLSRSNFRVWEGAAKEFDDAGTQLELHVDHILEESSEEDILFELLLKAGYPLTTGVTEIEVEGKRVHSIGDGDLLICLEDEVTTELVDGLAELSPGRVICLDAAFRGNDQLKTNAVQTFKARAESEETELSFVTV